MEKAIYSLVVMMIGQMVLGWGKSFYFKFKLYKQLKAEVKFIIESIKSNRERIEGAGENSFPLLKKLQMPVHDKLI